MGTKQSQKSRDGAKSPEIIPKDVRRAFARAEPPMQGRPLALTANLLEVGARHTAWPTPMLHSNRNIELVTGGVHDESGTSGCGFNEVGGGGLVAVRSTGEKRLAADAEELAKLVEFTSLPFEGKVPGSPTSN